MRARSTNRGTLTAARRQGAVNDATARTGRRLTRAVHGVAVPVRSLHAKVEVQGNLEVDQQFASATGYGARRAAARVMLPKRVRDSKSFTNLGKATGTGRTSTAHAIQDGGQLDVDDASVRAARHGQWWSIKAGSKASWVTTKASAAATISGARLTGRAVAGGARLTGQAARGSGRFVRASAARASVVATRISAGAAQAAVAAQTGARVAMLAARSAAAAVVSAASGTIMPAVVAALAAVSLMMAILPGFMTGAGYETERQQALGAVCGTEGAYGLGPVKPHVQAAANLVGPMFAVDDIGGWRAGDTYDYEGHPAGLALDVMVYLDRAKGQAIADYTRAHAAELGIKYVIWYRQIWSVARDSEGWRPMADRGSISANHVDHVHISFNPTPGTGTPADMLIQACNAETSTGSAAGVVIASGWAAPARSMQLGSPYGMRRHPITGVYKLHSGDDFPSGGCDAPIYAASSGTVTGVEPNRAYGMLVTINHGSGIQTRYAHMYSSGVLVRRGDPVTAGQLNARIGSNGYSTGCHLHFEVKINGTFVQPSTFLAERGIK